MTRLDDLYSSPETAIFRLKDLPPEIRDLIWDETLPSGRIFHVSDCNNVPHRHREVDSATQPRNKTFIFHIHNPPPTALHICKESRNLALRRGFFLSPHKYSTGVWFNPMLDVLYFDRNMRHLLKACEGKKLVHVEGWDKVLNVGVEWRAWFRDIPRLQPGDDMRPRWRAAIEALFVYAPQMRTINFILPKVRHVGGVTFGREPYEAARYACDLVPLPGMTKVPWDKMPRPGSPGVVSMATASLVDGRSYLTEWRAIRRDMELSLEPDGAVMETGEERDNSTGKVSRLPQVLGWWLLREGNPKNYEQQQVHEFS
ncbi:hypothetical protein TOPH_03559 [Tolypocladium ophioglossoides CBS 100239]|uniref:2EXR domain-containing protein n=1 Tax=Tolypocladium ophioglossoides (strain CBS 100239) TaxID=1163406 RepID=A0A0L0NCX9_TOLOC|nr:hypothetical protein TOPH_03559 [Tolypocladium ophioglossoides CBS 100239]